MGAAPLVGSLSFPVQRLPPVSQRWGPEAATCVVTGLQRAREYPILLLQSLEGNLRTQEESGSLGTTTSVRAGMGTHKTFTPLRCPERTEQAACVLSTQV